MKPLDVSVVIPTYLRERVLVATIYHLLDLQPAPREVLVVDQTPHHEAATRGALEGLESKRKIRWIRLDNPSITRAMNIGLEQAGSPIVLFVDDDIIPDRLLVAAHARAHENGANIVAGQVLQPGEEALEERTTDDGRPQTGDFDARSPSSVIRRRPEVGSQSSEFLFRSSRRQYISELMGGNFSIKRELGLALGGFDENFVHVAYRFEAEFASRALAAGEKILFEPDASIHHLKEKSGGTRAYGEHLTTIRPSHSVGAYYYLLRGKRVRHRVAQMFKRPLRAIGTKHHQTRPWWIPATLVAETAGFIWAVGLALRGPKLIERRERRAEGAKGKEQR